MKEWTQKARESRMFPWSPTDLFCPQAGPSVTSVTAEAVDF